MAFDPHGGLAPETDASAAPRLLRRPTEAPPRLDRVADGPALQALRHEWSLHTARRRALWSGSLPTPPGSGPERVSGRSRRRLVAALAGATLELADRCEVLTDRTMATEEVTEDVRNGLR